MDSWLKKTPRRIALAIERAIPTKRPIIAPTMRIRLRFGVTAKMGGVENSKTLKAVSKTHLRAH